MKFNNIKVFLILAVVLSLLAVPAVSAAPDLGAPIKLVTDMIASLFNNTFGELFKFMDPSSTDATLQTTQATVLKILLFIIVFALMYWGLYGRQNRLIEHKGTAVIISLAFAFIAAFGISGALLRASSGFIGAILTIALLFIPFIVLGYFTYQYAGLTTSFAHRGTFALLWFILFILFTGFFSTPADLDSAVEGDQTGLLATSGLGVTTSIPIIGQWLPAIFGIMTLVAIIVCITLLVAGFFTKGITVSDAARAAKYQIIRALAATQIVEKQDCIDTATDALKAALALVKDPKQKQQVKDAITAFGVARGKATAADIDAELPKVDKMLDAL